MRADGLDHQQEQIGARWAARLGLANCRADRLRSAGPPVSITKPIARGPAAAEVAKRYEDPIEVATDETGFESAPVSFRWRGRHYYIDDRLSSWREAGEWWRAADSAAVTGREANGNGSNGAREREYFRVLAHPAGMGATGELDADGFFVSCSSVYDIYRDRINGKWRLARIWD